MEFLGDASALFQAHVFLPDPRFLLFAGFNFSCRPEPSSGASLLDQGVVTKQEPPLNPILSKHSCLIFKCVNPRESTLPLGSYLLHVIGMNCPADHVARPKLLKCQTGIFPTHPVCVNELAVRPRNRNQLGDKINQLLKVLFRPLTLGYVHYGPHEFMQVAGSVEDGMAYDVNVSDPFVRMNDSVVQFEIHLVAGGFLERFPGPDLIAWVNFLKEFFESR